jgi:D-beta-D-heptose 7-phosphate kinase/D-beta-D-heptose 1-phosphate adenosyltransferase
MTAEKENEKEKPIVATSGYFDPLHIGHLECFEKAKKIADKIGGIHIVIINNDEQAKLKKGYSFMPEQERIRIVASLKTVDKVILSIDKDKSQCKTLEMLKPAIFAKGGDRNSGNIPEIDVCKKYNIKIIDGLGNKIQSSSDLIKRAEEIKLNQGKLIVKKPEVSYK